LGHEICLNTVLENINKVVNDQRIAKETNGFLAFVLFNQKLRHKMKKQMQTMTFNGHV